MPQTPNNLSLETIANGAEIKAQPLRDNYTEIQTEFNKVVAILDGGTVGQFLKKDGASSAAWADVTQAVAYGTSLPGSPVDGQEAILVDSTTAPTYQWRFRYNANSTHAHKWEFVGGSEVVSFDAAAATFTSSSYVDPTGGVVSWTAPRAGVYRFTFDGPFAVSQDSTRFMALKIGSAATQDADGIGGVNWSDAFVFSYARTVAASDVVKVQGKTTAGTVSVRGQTLRVVPIRVS